MEPDAPRESLRQRPAPACSTSRPYAPRRPQHSPLYRVLADHFKTLTHVHEEGYEPTHGALRPVVAEVVYRGPVARATGRRILL